MTSKKMRMSRCKNENNLANGLLPLFLFFEARWKRISSKTKDRKLLVQFVVLNL